MRSRCDKCGRDGGPACCHTTATPLTPVLCMKPSSALLSAASAHGRSGSGSGPRAQRAEHGRQASAARPRVRAVRRRRLASLQCTCDRSQIRTDCRRATRADLTLLRSYRRRPRGLCELTPIALSFVVCAPVLSKS